MVSPFGFKIPGWRPARDSLFYGCKKSSALDDSLSRDGVSIKTLVGENHKMEPQIKWNLKQGIKNNSVNWTGTTTGKGVTCMGYLILSQQIALKQWIKKEKNKEKGSKLNCNWVLDKEWAHKKKI